MFLSPSSGRNEKIRALFWVFMSLLLFLGLTLEFPYIPMLSVLLQAPYSLQVLLFFLYKTSCGFRSQTCLVDFERLYPGELLVTLMRCNSVVLVEDASCY